MKDGDVERPQWLHQPLAGLVPTRHRSRRVMEPGDAPRRQGLDRDAQSHRSPRGMEAAEGASGCCRASSLHAGGGEGPAGHRRWSWGGAGVSPGPGEVQMARGGSCHAAINQRRLLRALSVSGV